MATGLVLTVAQTLLSALQTKELRDLCSIFGYESQLADLESTVEIIKAVLLDAESKHQDLTNLGKDWLGKLKDAVYDADDLFDEFNTIAHQQKRIPGGKIFKKVCRFFSSDNQLLFAANTSQKIKMIRKKLDSIAKDRTQFGFSDVYLPIKRREETFSYVHESSIIGREADKETIMGLLGDLDSSGNGQDSLSFVSIVGIGGLGKTALAQLVYNDDRIKSAFELRLWVCVSEEFGMQEILSKMLGKSELRMEEMQREVRRQIEGKRYFFVLDDVWNESRNQWAKLREFLALGERGSRIIVTSRSKNVATAIGNYPVHQLKGLSDDDSWQLFKKMAFNEGSTPLDDTLVNIGKEIVKKCANVPLSLRVVGSMLYDQDKSKWLSFQSIDLANMGQGEEGIMPILKFSYYHLTPQLKSCFSYCALFPKDYEMKKKSLIRLWLAQGCLEPPNDSMNAEDVGEEYFFMLSQRCFLQDFENSEYSTRYSTCKMHDLIHDLALQVAGKESYLMVKTSTSPFDGKIRHLSVAVQRSLLLCPSNITSSKMRVIRTFLRPSHCSLLSCESQVATILAKCRQLRVLDLHELSIKALPSLNNLSHLRYLDLSDNFELEILPDSITRLHNLQVLNLHQCLRLKELPKDLRKLVNLRDLDITSCRKLTHMPARMDTLTGLCSLSMFVLGKGSSKLAKMGQLRELMLLKNLRGEVKIKFSKGYVYDATSVDEGAYLLNMEHIQSLIIDEVGCEKNAEPVVVDERLLERLEPHCYLKQIAIWGYKGITLPRWAAKLATSLPRLVFISLLHFHELQHLPPLSQLQHLKKLELIYMPNVEFMEDDNGAAVPSFPSLEDLTLIKCPSMKAFPECPHVKRLHLTDLNEALTFCRQRDNKANATIPAACTSNNNSGDGDVFDLQKITIDNLGLLKSLFGESLQSIHDLSLSNLEVEYLWSVVDEYQRYAFSIRNLRFINCQNLKSLSGGGIEHLTNLKELTIWYCPNLDLEEEEGVPWKALHALSSLNLSGLPQLVSIPKGLRHLTSLQVLRISCCENFETLPEWLDCLSSLRSLLFYFCHKVKFLPESILPFLTTLDIENCDGLLERYREPNGKDWSKLIHIPNVQFS